MKPKRTFVRGLAKAAAFWFGAFLLVLAVANAGELTDRFKHLQEIGRIDPTRAGQVVAVEPRDVIIGSLIQRSDQIEAEPVLDNEGRNVGLLVRLDLGESKGALWHIVIWVDDEDGQTLGVVYIAGRELPTRPA